MRKSCSKLTIAADSASYPTRTRPQEAREMSVEDNETSDDAPSSDSQCEMLFCDNGWVELRNPDDSDTQWLMANTSMEVRQ